MKEKYDLDKKDIHCIARILQGITYEDDPFYCCQYCKNLSSCAVKAEKGNVYKMTGFDTVRKKLSKLTGLYLGLMYRPELLKD